MDRHPLIGDVRGRGLMIGVELVKDRVSKERASDERNAVVQAAFRRGLLILGAGRNTVRFCPPLVMTADEADTAVRIFDEALSEVEAAAVKCRPTGRPSLRPSSSLRLGPCSTSGHHDTRPSIPRRNRRKPRVR